MNWLIKPKLCVRESIILVILSCFVVASCATNYRFVSQPNEATVYYENGNQKTLIGQTPIDFSKAALPTDSPFIIIFEKTGFEKKEVSVTPSDNTLTTVSVNLKPSPNASDETLKRTRATLQQIFAIQELIAQNKYVDALSGLKKLEEFEPNLPEVYVIRGSVYLLLNDKKQTKQQWEKALKLDPNMESLNVRLLKVTADLKLEGKP